MKGICALISHANTDIQGKLSCISKHQNNLNLANETLHKKLDQISEKVNETKPLLLSIQNQLQQQTAAKQKNMDNSLKSLKEVYDELTIHKSITSNQKLTITDLNSKIQTLRKDLKDSQLNTARKENLLKQLRLQPSPPATSSATNATNEPNDFSNTDNTNETSILLTPYNASTDALDVISTVSKALEVTNISINLQADPTTNNTSDSSQTSA